MSGAAQDLFGAVPGAIARAAEIEDGFRFSLTRTWDPAKPVAAWLMCNPSTANSFVDDPTIRRVMKFSAAAGCGTAEVVNIWPIRTPYPSELWHLLGSLSALTETKNIAAIERAAGTASIRFAAFGSGPIEKAKDYALGMVARFVDPILGTSPVVALGLNSQGWPLHPLARGKYAIRNGTEPKPWSFPKEEQ